MNEKVNSKMIEVSAVLIEMEKIIKSQVVTSVNIDPNDPVLQMTAVELVDLGIEVYKNLQMSTWSKK
jgi:hypothetical protein